jgi:hypothetical protein
MHNISLVTTLWEECTCHALKPLRPLHSIDGRTLQLQFLAKLAKPQVLPEHESMRQVSNFKYRIWGRRDPKNPVRSVAS